MLKGLARGLAAVLVLAEVLSFRVRAWVLGPDRALQGSTQLLSLVPGVTGQFVRRAFLRHALARFHPTAVLEFGTLLSRTAARIDERVYVGPHCHLGWVHLERDVLLGPGVHVPSGPWTHGIANAKIAIREQPGRLREVTIGEGSWIGSGAIVLADVGRHSVVGAGSVVTRPVPDYAIAAGVPARILVDRRLATPLEPAAARSAESGEYSP